MLFNSIGFAVFLPIVFAIYWLLPHKYRWALILASSYYFYMSWNPKYVVIILATTMVSYFAALGLEKTNEKKKKRLILLAAAVVCFGMLFFFKYFNFFSESVIAFLNLFSLNMSPWTLKLVLPVGISFYTFQTFSYVCDVYRGDIKAEHHFGYYAAFISFFPQLVAGPIERTENLLPQIKAEHVFNYDQATYGLKLMAWGYFKKLVVADGLLPYVSKVFDAPQNFQGFSLVLATVFFTFQIYCDFSGYSDIAVGTSKLLGIELMTNFKSPYFSQSVKEFWSRWHISLSSWFRDYVYIPLGGNRCSRGRHALNLMLTFLASGLWHGAEWTFVFWGGLHGVAQIFETFIFPNARKKSLGIFRWLRIGIVFIFCSFAWIFFISNTIGDAVYVVTQMLNGISSPITYLQNGFVSIGMDKFIFLEKMMVLLLLAVYDYLSLKRDVIAKIGEKHKVIRWSVYVCFGLILIFFSQKGVAAEFVYFQF